MRPTSILKVKQRIQDQQKKELFLRAFNVLKPLRQNSESQYCIGFHWPLVKNTLPNFG